MARLGWPERNRAARSFRQLRRFHHVINSDKVFGTHRYRGHLDFVDDNFIGNKKSLRLFLPELAAWQRTHDYPFEFSTEASVNLADDPALLEMMAAANFFGIFVGIESPHPATLVAMKKKQNTRRNIAERIHTIYGAGMLVTAGF